MTAQSTPPAKPSMPSEAPQPEPIRWFGTTWVNRGADYLVRRVLVSLGALAATVAGAFLLRFAVAGVGMSESGGFVYGLLVAAIAVCSCLAAVRTWKLLTEGRDSLTGWMAEDKSLGAVWLVGFAGSLAAYFFRSLAEAPGEAVHRRTYDQATAQYDRRRANRTGRPGGKRKR